MLHMQSHLTVAGNRKCEGFSLRHLLFVLTNLVFLHIKIIHDLPQRPLQALFLAHFCDPGPQFRAYLNAITNACNHFFPMQGCES